MIPSHKWFPTRLQERAAWYASFANQFSLLAVSLGFTAADATAVEADNDVMQFVAGTQVVIENYSDAVRQYRIAITEGDIGDPTPAFPAPIGPTPGTTVPTGIYERLDNLVKRIRVAPAYTDETGALLGILPSKTEDVSPDEMRPALKAKSMPTSIVEVEFARHKTDGVMIQMQLDKADVWEDAGRFFKSPANLSIPTNGGGPREVRVRARFLQGNSAIGQFSDIVATVTQP